MSKANPEREQIKDFATRNPCASKAQGTGR